MEFLLALFVAVAAILAVASLAFSWLTRRDVQKLLEALRKTHDGEPYPSAAAVVTAPSSPRSSPVEVASHAAPDVPELARQRVALRPDPEHGGHDIRAVERLGASPALGDMLEAPPAPRPVGSSGAARVSPLGGAGADAVVQEIRAQGDRLVDAIREASEAQRASREATADTMLQRGAGFLRDALEEGTPRTMVVEPGGPDQPRVVTLAPPAANDADEDE